MNISGDLGSAAGGGVTDKAFTRYDIQACLYDARRVEYLRDAIVGTVKEGDVVVDAGSGTGVLGLLAAKHGAARVYCVELNPEFIEVIEENAGRNGLADKIHTRNADAARWEPPEPVDVLIGEVISGGFFYEPQLQIINNLRRFLTPGGSIVPMAMTNHVELINAQELLYGLTFNFDSRFTELADDRSLSTGATYLSTNFYEFNDPAISGRARVRATETAAANAVKITYDIRFAPEVASDGPTQFLLNPQVIYLPEPVPLESGREYEVLLDYQAADSPLACKINVMRVSD